MAAILCAMLAALAGLPAAAWSAGQHGGHGHGHGHAAPAGAAKRTAELGTSAAVDSAGRLWIVGKETAADGQYATVQVSSDLGRTWSAPRRIQARPEPVAAEGENRPKIAFGPRDELYITYTKPLAKPYTGEIRLVRSLDGGKRFLPPVTVHANRDLITHRFDSLIVDRAGRVYVAWIDKRDLEQAKAKKQRYRGAALYYAVSEDSGASFRGDFKVADHSCECCRIALALTPDDKVAAMWRHVFAPNVRDHAYAILPPDGKVAAPERVTFEDWKIDACPHHGPALAFDSAGKRYQAWFNVKAEEGGVFFAAAAPGAAAEQPVALGSAQAAHADIAVQGDDVVVAWKQFDGKSTTIASRMSRDRGKTWSELELARTSGPSDQPRLVATAAGIILVWRTRDEGVRVFHPAGAAT